VHTRPNSPSCQGAATEAGPIIDRTRSRPRILAATLGRRRREKPEGVEDPSEAVPGGKEPAVRLSENAVRSGPDSFAKRSTTGGSSLGRVVRTGGPLHLGL